MKLWRRKRQVEKSVEPTPEPTDPFLDDGVEKLELIDGSVVLLDQCRVVHIVNNRAVKGNVVNPDTFESTRVVRVVENSAIRRHVAMGFRNSDRSLREIDVTPRSLR